MKALSLLSSLLVCLTLAPSVLSELRIQELSKQSLESHSSVAANAAEGSILAVRNLAEEHDDEEEHHGDEEEHHDDEARPARLRAWVDWHERIAGEADD